MQFDVHRLLVISLIVLSCAILFTGGVVVHQFRQVSTQEQVVIPEDTSARIAIEVVNPVGNESGDIT